MNHEASTDHGADGAGNESAPGRWAKPPAWAISLSIFYTIMIGIVIGKVIVKTTRGGGDSAGPQVLRPVASNHFALVGAADALDADTLLVRVLPVMPQAGHAALYAGERLKELGISSGRGLLQLHVENFQREGSVTLSDQAGSLVLEDEKGKVASIPLPGTAETEALMLSLVQRRLDGELQSGTARTGWKVMEREVDLAKVTAGEFRLGDGRVVKLQPSTEGR